MKYSCDFYVWMLFCSLPTLGFIYALMHRHGRPWAKKAIEDADDTPNHVDLTFLMTLVTGWILCYGMFASVGLTLFENIDMVNMSYHCFSGVCILWGINKIGKIAEVFKRK